MDPTSGLDCVDLPSLPGRLFLQYLSVYCIVQMLSIGGQQPPSNRMVKDFSKREAVFYTRLLKTASPASSTTGEKDSHSLE